MRSFCRSFFWQRIIAFTVLLAFFLPLIVRAGESESGLMNGASVMSNSPGSGSPQSMNPDFSLDGLFDFSQFDRENPVSFKGGHDPKINGFTTQQVELTFGSPVDPYFRADSNLVLVPEDGVVHIEIEEAYATSLDFPYNLQLKAGAFFSAFGRNNPVHPHAWDFVNKPLVLARMFGGDGLRNAGAQISWLSPLPWYSEFIVSSQNGSGDTAASFLGDGKMKSASDLMLLGRWNNFFDVAETIALNLGTSFVTGPNPVATHHYGTKILGGDVYLKIRQANSLSFVGIQSEILKRGFDTADSTVSDWGWYTQLVYRLAEPRERWVAGLRFDWMSDKQPGAPNTSNGNVDPISNLPADLDTSVRYRISPNITFFSSEFSKVRLQYDFDRASNFTQQVAHLEFEFIIGAHGAHKF
jgi:hypothetical protein